MLNARTVIMISSIELIILMCEIFNELIYSLYRMHLIHLMHTYILLTSSISIKDIIDSRWVREEGRLTKRPVTDMSTSDNEASRIDQLENSLAKITEQLQALTTAVAGMAVPRAGGNSENVRYEEPPNGLRDDIPIFDDDMAECATGRMIGSPVEF